VRKNAIIWMLVIGVLFLINAIFGRYLVLPGYLESLENGSVGIPDNVGAWKIIRYLIWAYSFKLGILFIVIGALLKTHMGKGRLWLYVFGGLLYISFAYIPLPGPFSIIFGIGGGIMTVLIVLIFQLLLTERSEHYESTGTATELKIIGYFFFAMATYNLCPLLGVKAFALEPEKMIAYGLQSEAASFATHILIELVLGWTFIFFSHFRNSNKVIKWTR
jgi:hypothetical protein